MYLEHVMFHKSNSIASITLNRPEALNALNRKLWLEITETLDEVEADGAARAIILTGSGRAFSSGDDIREVCSLRSNSELKAFFLNVVAPTIIRILTLTKPIIAAVNGLAY